MRLPSSTHPFLILASGGLWASAGAVAQIVPDVASAALADCRLVVGALVLAAVIGPARLWRELKALPLPTFIAGSVAMGLFQWSFFAAAVTVGGWVATLVSVGASPLCADLIEARASHKPLPLRWWLETAGCLFGIALLVESSNLPIAGVFTALFAGAAYAVYAATAARMERQNGSARAGIVVTTLALAGGGLALLPAALPRFESLLSLPGLMMTAYLGVAVTALAYGMFVIGLRTVNVGTALALQVVQPLGAIVIDAVLLSSHSYSFAAKGPVIAGTGIIIALMFIRSFTTFEKPESTMTQKPESTMTKSPRRALILIDVQNEYITGNLLIEYPDIRLSLRNIGRAAAAAVAAGIPIVVVQNTAPPTAPIFVKGTSGWELHPTVAALPASRHVEKTLPSAFAGTDLAAWLKDKDINVLTVAGYMTHNCVDSTIRHALHEGWQVEHLHDATGAVSYANRAGKVSAEEIHKSFSVVLQSRFAAVLTTDEWIDAVNSGKAPERDNIFNSNQRARLVV